MAQKSGFFNALQGASGYDRTYNANDYTDNLAVIISNGVLQSAADDLKVTASGLNLTVGAGRAWIKGHYYFNDSEYALPPITTPTGGSRIDRVILRFDNTLPVRAITLQYLTGTAATSPVPPEITRNDDIYDLVIAEVLVAANATSVTVTDKRADASVCGWVYSVSGDGSFFRGFENDFYEWFSRVKDTLSSVTLFKRYTWNTTLSAETQTVQFNIPQYDADTDFFEVYVNGFLNHDYTADNDVLTFTAPIIAGTDVTVLSFKSLDGTGIESVAEEITQLQREVAAISGAGKYVYICTGSDDNISLSQIAQAIYAKDYDAEQCTDAANAFIEKCGGLEWLQSLEADAQITIEVVGTLGATTPAYGSGESSNPYRYFNIGQTAHSDMRLMFDFAKCETIRIECADNTSNIIFFGTDLQIKNAEVNAYNSGTSATACNIQMVAGANVGAINVENCVFDVTATADGSISDAGTYINCDCTVKSKGGNAFCFTPSSEKLLRVIGGRFLAYVTNTTNFTAAVFYTSNLQTDAVVIAQNINCPTIAYSDGGTSYYQQYLSSGNAGETFIDFVISELNSTGNFNTIKNQIWLSKSF